MPLDPIVPCLAAVGVPLFPPGKGGHGQSQGRADTTESPPGWLVAVGVSPGSVHSTGTGWEDVVSWDGLTLCRRLADNTFTAGIGD